MARPAEDLTGQVFTRLTVLERDFDVHTTKNAYWKVKCECGTIKTVQAGNLKKKRVTSCGCLRIEKQVEMNKDLVKRLTTHGLSKTRLYRIWYAMNRRCDDPRAGNYKYYGASGITVSPEWKDIPGFLAFREWSLNNGYEDHLTIDRIYNDEGYSPFNCQWSTMKEQAQNRRPRGSV